MKLNRKKGNKGNNDEAVVVEEEEETQATVEETTEEVATETVETAPVPQVPAIAVASIPTRGGDSVAFHCTVAMEPPPRIGPFSIGSELSITKMTAGQTYVLPRQVAEVLVDCQKGFIKG